MKEQVRNWIQNLCPNAEWKEYLLGLIDGSVAVSADPALIAKVEELEKELSERKIDFDEAQKIKSQALNLAKTVTEAQKD